MTLRLAEKNNMDSFFTTIHDCYKTIKDAAHKNNMSVQQILNHIKNLEPFNGHLYLSEKSKVS
jgi:hypothetical protein